MFGFRKLKALFNPAAATPFERALRALETGEYESAMALLDDLLASPQLSRRDCAILANKRGVALVRLARRDEALEAFRTCLELVPRYAPAMTNLGNLLFEEGRIDEAIAYYEAAVRNDDRHAAAHRNLGIAYRAAGRIEDAVREFRRAVRLGGRRS